MKGRSDAPWSAVARHRHCRSWPNTTEQTSLRHVGALERPAVAAAGRPSALRARFTGSKIALAPSLSKSRKAPIIARSTLECR